MQLRCGALPADPSMNDLRCVVPGYDPKVPRCWNIKKLTSSGGAIAAAVGVVGVPVPVLLQLQSRQPPIMCLSVTPAHNQQHINNNIADHRIDQAGQIACWWPKMVEYCRSLIFTIPAVKRRLWTSTTLVYTLKVFKHYASFLSFGCCKLSCNFKQLSILWKYHILMGLRSFLLRTNTNSFIIWRHVLFQFNY